MASCNLNNCNIDKDNLLLISDWAKDYAVSKGILMRSPDLSKDSRILLPFCIVPSAVPRKWFELAYKLQPYLNMILFKISHSKEFLKECLASTIEADDYTANIFKIYETAEVEQSEQLSLGLIRSDYLLDSDSTGNVTGLKQVENNTISASFGGLAPSIQDLHRYILRRLGKTSFIDKLPENESLDGISKGIIAAWDAYGNPSAIILIVVEENTKNICDQRAVEHKIVEYRCDIKISRHTFNELRSLVSLKGKVLYIGNQEVAVVYYRTGYVPGHYEKEDWETRLLMERSNAIKCPSAGLHLAGTKRVQVQLTYPGVLEKFVDSDVAKMLRQVFVNQYTLDIGEEGDKAISLAIINPEKYVLKPEREGGGNNVYGAEIKIVLENIKTSNERNAYILMERINPPLISNCIIIRDKFPVVQNVICELGTFGVILGDKKEIRLNNCAGHLLRSKESFRNETGVAAGFGALDSPYLS